MYGTSNRISQASQIYRTHGIPEKISGMLLWIYRLSLISILGSVRTRIELEQLVILQA